MEKRCSALARAACHSSVAHAGGWISGIFLLQRLSGKPGSRTKDVSAHCHRMSLCFRQPVTESTFVEERLRTHSIGMQTSAFFAILVCAAALIDQPVASPSPGRGVESHRTVMRVRWAALSFGTFLSIILFIVARVMPTSQALEKTTSVLMCLLIMCIFSCEPQYIIPALRLDAEETMGSSNNFEESPVLLGILGVIAVSRASLHIRWCVFVWVDVTSFIICLASGHLREKPLWLNWLLFGAILAAGSMGTRSYEVYEREAFWREPLQEKCFAVESEFRVDTEAQQQLQQRQARTMDSSSDVSFPVSNGTSLPETTDTGRLFKTFGDSTISDIVSIGQREQWLLHAHEIEIHDTLIGAGGFGVVYRGSFSCTPVALKIPRRQTVNTKEGLLDFANELRVLRKVKHPNIIVCHGACIDQPNIDIFLVLEYSDGVNMEAIVVGKVIGPLHDLERFEILQGVSRALCYLHSREPAIVHGDLKSSNILVEMKAKSGSFKYPLHKWRMHPKLLDFGLARLCTRGAQKCGGTARWAAPELFASTAKRPSPAVDVFSFGRLMYFTLTEQMPLANLAQTDILDAMELKRLPPLHWAGRSKLQAAIRPCAEVCMSEAPELRPSIHTIVHTLSGLASSEAYLRQGGADDGGTGGYPPSPDTLETPLWMHVRQCRQASQQPASQRVGMEWAPSGGVSASALPRVPELEAFVQVPPARPSSACAGHRKSPVDAPAPGNDAEEDFRGVGAVVRQAHVATDDLGNVVCGEGSGGGIRRAPTLGPGVLQL